MVFAWTQFAASRRGARGGHGEPRRQHLCRDRRQQVPGTPSAETRRVFALSRSRRTKCVKDSELDIVGLFPSFDSERFGGVQASGREAWQGIVSRIGERRSNALYYEAGSSKARAVLRAIRNRKSANVVLVWHLHLLKLLPFLDSSTARVILFLHGIEAWLKQDSLTQFVLRKVDLILSNSGHTWGVFLTCSPSFQSVPHQTVHLGAGSCLGAATPRPAQAPAVLMVGRLNKSENYKGHRDRKSTRSEEHTSELQSRFGI